MASIGMSNLPQLGAPVLLEADNASPAMAEQSAHTRTTIASRTSVPPSRPI